MLNPPSHPGAPLSFLHYALDKIKVQVVLWATWDLAPIRPHALTSIHSFCHSLHASFCFGLKPAHILSLSLEASSLRPSFASQIECHFFKAVFPHTTCKLGPSLNNLTRLLLRHAHQLLAAFCFLLCV